MSSFKDQVIQHLCTRAETGEDVSDLACPGSRYGTTTKQVAGPVATALEAIQHAIDTGDWRIWADQLMDGAVNDTSEVEELIREHGDNQARQQLTEVLSTASAY